MPSSVLQSLLLEKVLRVYCKAYLAFALRWLSGPTYSGIVRTFLVTTFLIRTYFIWTFFTPPFSISSETGFENLFVEKTCFRNPLFAFSLRSDLNKQRLARNAAMGNFSRRNKMAEGTLSELIRSLISSNQNVTQD